MEASAKFVDKTGEYTSQRALLERNAVAGFMEWASFLSSYGSIEIKFRFIDEPATPGGGQPVTVVAAGHQGGRDIYESGAAFEIRTGVDPNGDRPDINVFFDVGNVEQHYWINPLDGSEAPADRMDLVKVIAHELGHALGFIGYRDWVDYQFPPGSVFASPFDVLVNVVSDQPYFTGENAQGIYGGPVPLTAENLFHLGNDTGPGGDLVGDLMNGVTLDPAVDYAVSLLDVAILSDLGLPTIFDDALLGSKRNDLIDGGPGDDLIEGRNGHDNLFGGDGHDTLLGGNWIDFLEGGLGDDILGGGAGGDHAGYLDATSAVIVSLLMTTAQNTFGAGWDTLIEIEHLQGSDYDDALEGDGLDNILVGQQGNDTLIGGDGGDTLYGTDGIDRLLGGGGRDIVNGGWGKDVLIGEGGTDTFEYYEVEDGGDRIVDLTSRDWISLHYIDADTGLAGDQAFELVDAFSNNAGEAVLMYQAGKQRTLLLLDVDGDAIADMTAKIDGDHRGFTNFML